MQNVRSSRARPVDFGNVMRCKNCSEKIHDIRKDCESFQNKAVDEPRFPAAIYPSSLYFFVLILAVD